MRRAIHIQYKVCGLSQYHLFHHHQTVPIPVTELLLPPIVTAQWWVVHHGHLVDIYLLLPMYMLAPLALMAVLSPVW